MATDTERWVYGRSNGFYVVGITGCQTNGHWLGDLVVGIMVNPHNKQVWDCYQSSHLTIRKEFISKPLKMFHFSYIRVTCSVSQLTWQPSGKREEQYFWQQAHFSHHPIWCKSSAMVCNWTNLLFWAETPQAARRSHSNQLKRFSVRTRRTAVTHTVLILLYHSLGWVWFLLPNCLQCEGHQTLFSDSSLCLTL